MQASGRSTLAKIFSSIILGGQTGAFSQVRSIYITKYHKSHFALRSFAICTAYMTHRHSNKEKLKEKKTINSLLVEGGKQ